MRPSRWSRNEPNVSASPGATSKNTSEPICFSSIQEFLKAKGASEDILKEVGKLSPDIQFDISSESGCDDRSDSDLLRDLQSATSKVANLSKAIEVADSKVDKVRSALDKEVEARNALIDKRNAVDSDIAAIKSKLSVSAPSPEHIQRLQTFEQLFIDIADKIKAGIPAENTDERRLLYDLIFKAPVGAQQSFQQQPHGAAAADSSVDADPVDRDGFGFGPASGPEPPPGTTHCGKGGKSSGTSARPY